MIVLGKFFFQESLIKNLIRLAGENTIASSASDKSKISYNVHPTMHRDYPCMENLKT